MCYPGPKLSVYPAYSQPFTVSPCWQPVRVIRIVEVKPVEVVQQPTVRKEDVAPEGWCHIKGRVVFEGDPIPRQKEIPNSRGAYTEDWVVHPENRGVMNAIVWLAPEPSPEDLDKLKSRRLREFPSFVEKDIYPALPKPKDRRVLMLEGPIAFNPHVAALRAGSDVVFQNTSTRPENVKWVSRDNDEVNKALSQLVGEFRMTVKPERFPIEVSSSVHPWMKAWLRVFDHPYFAVTDPSGNFEIRFAPRGNLRLFVWQESVGFRNGREGRLGDPIRAPSGRLDLGELKFRDTDQK